MTEVQGWTEGPVSFDIEVWRQHLADLKARRDDIPDYDRAVAEAERTIAILAGEPRPQGGESPAAALRAFLNAETP
ncbi:hypothetical protein [Tropicimonas sp. S265A]|uniref:hypothetical protein n=1 Tax=Tropicimonas sp. S265A TaxID=3415134 RepID=UPI003C7B0181